MGDFAASREVGPVAKSLASPVSVRVSHPDRSGRIQNPAPNGDVRQSYVLSLRAQADVVALKGGDFAWFVRVARMVMPESREIPMVSRFPWFFATPKGAT